MMTLFGAGGGCATIFSVLMNDPSDPLNFGPSRKHVDELYGFGATPVFHDQDQETANHYGCKATGVNRHFKGAIYRTVRMNDDGEEVHFFRTYVMNQNESIPCIHT